VLAFAHGLRTTLPVEHQDVLQPYPHPVAVGGGSVAVVRLAWPSVWCWTGLPVDRLDLDLGGGRGTLATNGFRRPACSSDPAATASGELRAGTFQPPDWTPETAASPVRALDVSVQAPDRTPAGKVLHLTVTLTAREHDVALTPCPDYLVGLATYDGGQPVQHRYALDCDRIPTRTAAGDPAILTGRPVTMAFDVDVPAGARAGAKLFWFLDPPDGVSAGTLVTIS
jgi:hypothetical protein